MKAISERRESEVKEAEEHMEGKSVVFGIYKRNGKVYTEIVKNCSRRRLQATIKGKVNRDSTIYSDKRRGYNGLVDLGYKRHYRLDHERDEFVSGRSHIKRNTLFHAQSISLQSHLIFFERK
jgi:transposase-like protein